METVAYLVEHVVRRFAGSSGEHEAAHYLAAEFKRLGLNVRIERFRFMGWELHEIPRLKILKPMKSDMNKKEEEELKNLEHAYKDKIKVSHAEISAVKV